MNIPVGAIMHDNRRYLVIVIALAIVTHISLICYVHFYKGGLEAYAFNSLDAREYYQIARNVASHGTFSQAGHVPFTPDTWRTPGYPVFLAGWVWLMGAAPWGLVVVQQLLCVVNAALFYFVARQYLSSGRLLLAAGAFVLEPYHLFYSFWLLATTLFVTLLLFVWLSFLRAERTKSVRWFMVAGVLCGLLVLVRPIGIMVPVLLGLRVFVGLVMPTCELQAGDRGWSWPMLAGFCLATLCIMGVWVGRNARVAGHMALSDQSGVVMAYFKASEVVLWREGRSSDRFMETSLDPKRSEEPHAVWEEIDRRLRQSLDYLPASKRERLTWRNLAQGNKTEVDSFLISQELMRIGLSQMAESPLSTAACLATRCGSILTFPLNLAIKPAAGVDASGGRQLLKSLPYVVLTMIAFWSVVRYRRAWRDWCVPMLMLLGLLAMTTPQFDPRFRVPMIPMLLVLALLKTEESAT